MLLFTYQIVALDGILHLGAVKSGIAKANRIAQGKHVQIKSFQAVPMQVDGESSPKVMFLVINVYMFTAGEPFIQSPCVMNINVQGRCLVIVFLRSFIHSCRVFL